jgi:hypothetical protein
MDPDPVRRPVWTLEQDSQEQVVVLPLGHLMMFEDDAEKGGERVLIDHWAPTLMSVVLVV